MDDHELGTRWPHARRRGLVVVWCVRLHVRASEFGDLTLSGPAWERVTAPISIQRFDTLLSLTSAITTDRHYD